MFGGEPTTHPDLLKIISDLSSSISLGIFTNLSESLSYYNSLLDIKPNISFETSYHPDRTLFEDYHSKIKFLADRGIPISVNFMMDSKYSENLISNYRLLQSTCAEVTPYIIDYKDQDLSKDLLSWVASENSNKLKTLSITYSENNRTHTLAATPGFLWANQLTNFKFFRCDCGKRCLFISSNGDVYPCIDYMKHNLGNLFNVSEEYSSKLESILNNSVICKSSQCTSAVDVRKKRILNV